MNSNVPKVATIYVLINSIEWFQGQEMVSTMSKMCDLYVETVCCLLSRIKILWFVGLRKDRTSTWYARHWGCFDESFLLPDSFNTLIGGRIQRAIVGRAEKGTVKTQIK